LQANLFHAETKSNAGSRFLPEHPSFQVEMSAQQTSFSHYFELTQKSFQQFEQETESLSVQYSMQAKHWTPVQASQQLKLTREESPLTQVQCFPKVLVYDQESKSQQEALSTRIGTSMPLFLIPLERSLNQEAQSKRLELFLPGKACSPVSLLLEDLLLPRQKTLFQVPLFSNE
jgi:hypothetical protein